MRTLPEGEIGLGKELEKLRFQVEQMRLVDSKLETAENILDRRLNIARQRKQEVGFVREVLASSGCKHHFSSSLCFLLLFPLLSSVALLSR